MADYKVANLDGESVKFNASQRQFDIMIANAIDELEVDASTHKSTMDTDNTSLVANNKAMMTELSAHPPSASPPAAEVLQAEVDSEKETPSVQLANPNVTSATTNASSSFNNFFRSASETKTLPTTDTGSYTVTTNSTSITVSAGNSAITGKATTPKDATVVVDGESEKKNISEFGFTNRPTIQYQDCTEETYFMELDHYVVGGHEIRMYGFIDLRDIAVTPRYLTTGQLYTEKEFEAGYARRRIYPLGAITLTQFRRDDSVDRIKNRDVYKVFVGDEDGQKIIVVPKPRLFNYTGWYNAATGCTTYFQILYKYNSKYDPN